jgi:putative membrane protein
LKGDRFDWQFARDEITAHRHAIAVYKHEADHGENADVKAYAAKMISLLEKHLKLAEDCVKPAGRC